MSAMATWTSEELGVDAAYHAKYDRYGPQNVGSATGPKAHAGTVRLAKADQHDRPEVN